MSHEQFGRAIAVVGLQFGSEGKGAVASYVGIPACAAVRIGGANAGHTCYVGDKPYVMRQLPCQWSNPWTKLILGIGAVIDLPVLMDEIRQVEVITPIQHRLYIDQAALVITDEQRAREESSGLAARIASTSARSGGGIGTALADKVLRKENCMFARDVSELRPYISDTTDMLLGMLERDEIILFEGTQGFGLSIDHGHFPFVTSRDTTAQSLFSGAGINPYGFDVEVIGVARTYPIRVGGNSGPFDLDSKEMLWGDIVKLAGIPHHLEEKTSVTNVTRRVATFSWGGFERACRINRPKEIALTHADYLDWSVHESEELTPNILRFIDQMEEVSGIGVGIVKTGPMTLIDFDSHRRTRIRQMAAP